MQLTMLNWSVLGFMAFNILNTYNIFSEFGSQMSPMILSDFKQSRFTYDSNYCKHFFCQNLAGATRVRP